MLSVDYRTRPLSPSLEDSYPWLGRLVRGTERLYATVAVAGASLVLDGRIRCKGASAADKLLRFLKILRDGGSQREEYAALLGGLVLKQADTNINIRWELPREAIRGWLQRASPKQPLPSLP